MDARAAADSARALLDGDTEVVTIQNGLGAADVVAGALPEKDVMVGVAGGFGASVVAPGRVHHHGMELIRLGQRIGPVTEATERIAGVWRDAGFAVKTYDDVTSLIWEKLICNACYSGVCGLLELTIAEVLADQHAWPIASACAQEALDVGRACGADLPIDDSAAYVRDFGLKIPGARPSLLLDLLAGRRTEIEWINGAVPREAATVGLQAPTNQLITTLVLAKEARSRHADETAAGSPVAPAPHR
jgi:2-dehydropantoate 2-reductase